MAQLMHPTPRAPARRDPRLTRQIEAAGARAPGDQVTMPSGVRGPGVTTPQDREPLQGVPATAGHRGPSMGAPPRPVAPRTKKAMLLRAPPRAAPPEGPPPGGLARPMRGPRTEITTPRPERPKSRTIQCRVRSTASTITRATYPTTRSPRAPTPPRRPRPVVTKGRERAPRRRAGRPRRPRPPRPRPGPRSGPKAKPTPTTKTAPTTPPEATSSPWLAMPTPITMSLPLRPRARPWVPSEAWPRAILPGLIARPLSARPSMAPRRPRVRMPSRVIRQDPTLAEAIFPDHHRAITGETARLRCARAAACGDA